MLSHSPIRLVLDTNIIFGDWYLNGALRPMVKELIDRAGFTVFIPQIVLDEAERKYAQESKQAYKTLSEATNHARRFFREWAPSEIPSEDFKKNQQDYKAELERIVRDEFGGDILQYPTTSHEGPVKWALQSKKPFDGEGRNGYRDWVIWHSTVLASEGGTYCVLLLTDNSTDFGIKRKPNVLHPDLREYLRSEGLNEDTVRLVTGTRNLDEQYLKPTTQALDEIVNEINGQGYNGLLTQDIISAFAEQALQIALDRFTVDDRLFSSSVESVHSHSGRVTEVRQNKDLALIVTLNLDIDATIHALINMAFIDSNNYDGLTLIPPVGDHDVQLVSYRKSFNVSFYLVFDQRTRHFLAMTENDVFAIAH